MNYIITDTGVKFVDDDRNPITIDEALVTIRRIAAWIEAIGNEPKPNSNAEIAMDRGAGSVDVATEAA